MLEHVGWKIFKVNSKNVIKFFSGVFRCKVGVNYGFNSEIYHQSRCIEKKKCHLKVQKVLKSKKKSASINMAS